jgi:hypothetical protein
MFLDSDPESVAQRKAELPVAEIRRQNHEYRELRFSRGRKAVVRTDAGIKSTLFASTRTVAEFIEQRLARRMRNWKRIAA